MSRKELIEELGVIIVLDPSSTFVHASSDKIVFYIDNLNPDNPVLDVNKILECFDVSDELPKEVAVENKDGFYTLKYGYRLLDNTVLYPIIFTGKNRNDLRIGFYRQEDSQNINFSFYMWNVLTGKYDKDFRLPDSMVKKPLSTGISALDTMFNDAMNQ